MIIDIHAHTSSKPLWGLHTPTADLATIEALMDKHDVSLVVLMATYFPFKTSTRGGGGTSNARLAELIKGNPRFKMFGSLDASQGANLDEGLSDLRARAQTGSLAGIKLYPGYQDFHPAMPRMFPVYRLAEEYGLPVMFHTGELHHCCPWTERQAGHLRCGYPTCQIDQLGHLARPRSLAIVTACFPEVKFVFSHLGNPHFEEMREVMRTCPNVYTDISGQFLSGTAEDTPEEHLLLKHEIEKFLALPNGADRLMFGTDFPIQSYEDTIALVDSLDCSIETETKILRKNAEKLLGITSC